MFVIKSTRIARIVVIAIVCNNHSDDMTICNNHGNDMTRCTSYYLVIVGITICFVMTMVLKKISAQIVQPMHTT